MPKEVPDDTHDVQGSMQASPVRKYSDLSVHFETMLLHLLEMTHKYSYTC